MSGLILEDCPFCGNHKAVCKESSVFSWVACLICSAQGPACLTRPEARRAWNVATIKNRELLATSDPFYSNEPNDIICRVNPSEFAALKSEVNAILKAVASNPPKDRYCVNYADLRCVNVSRAIEEDGGQWWLVEMEEGDDHEFCQLVRSQLSERWGSVIVRMEW